LYALKYRRNTYNETQRVIVQHLFHYNQATITELAVVVAINEKTVRLYLNQFVEDENFLDRLSDKKRDKNAKYTFKKN